MRLRHFAVVALAVTAAALAATSARATPFHPAAGGLPFTPLTKQDVQQAPTCFNGFLCYSPQMIRDAYDFPNGRGAPTGAGETIVVVVANGSPFLELDVQQFNDQFQLPPADIVPLPQQNVLVPGADGDGTVFQWALETSLDVEWAHAIAPGARIVVAVAVNSDSSNIAQTVKEAAAAYPDAVFVHAFGGDESGPLSDPDAEATMDRAFASIAAHGGSVVASSGDLGATGSTIFYSESPTLMAAYPAASPLVLAVGGTEGSPYPGGLWNNGRYGGEQVWNEVFADGSAGASGGAVSAIYRQPIWQRGIAPSGGRAVPDVAYNAATNGGVVISFLGQFGAIGGTSAGAPQWGGILALANELRAKRHRTQVGLVTPVLYLLARSRTTYRQDFHDITSGNNIILGADSGLPGFTAGAGYDLPTGLGTPDVSKLLDDLAGNEPWFARFSDLLTSHGHGKGHVTFKPGR